MPEAAIVLGAKVQLAEPRYPPRTGQLVVEVLTPSTSKVEAASEVAGCPAAACGRRAEQADRGTGFREQVEVGRERVCLGARGRGERVIVEHLRNRSAAAAGVESRPSAQVRLPGGGGAQPKAGLSLAIPDEIGKPAREKRGRVGRYESAAASGPEVL